MVRTEKSHNYVKYSFFQTIKKKGEGFIKFFSQKAFVKKGKQVVPTDVKDLPNPHQVQKIAETIGIGYKAAHVLALKKMVQELKTLIPVVIPEEFCLTHEELIRHLKAHDPHIQTLWQQLQKVLRDQRKNCAEKVVLTDQEREKLEEIRERISQVFDNHPYETEKLNAYLGKHQNHQLIVRSTGKEDSDTLSNAGGNQSVPFVCANKDSLNHALKEVISSYFSPHSIQQRIASRDASVFTAGPFVPVLIQQMCMESAEDLDNQTPFQNELRSGVIFTNPFPDDPDFVMIQTGYGNNHGIVSSQVCVDTYLVNRAGEIFKTIQKKDTKLQEVSHQGRYTLEKVAVDSSFASRQALSDPIIQELASVAEQIARKYGTKGQKKSMDLEYSVRYEKGKPKIYLYQARPIVKAQTKPKEQPSYLVLQKEQTQIRGKTLLHGDSYVRTVTNPDQIVCAPDLSTAYSLYMQKRSFATCVVIGKNAPMTSHEAVMLASLGVAVLVIEDQKKYAQVEAMVHQASSKQVVYVSPQQHMIMSCAFSKMSEVKKKGRVRFPLPLETSVDVPRRLLDAMEQADEEKLKAFLLEMDAQMKEIGSAAVEDLVLQNARVEDLLDMMAIEPSHRAEQASVMLMQKLHAVVKRYAQHDFNPAKKIGVYEMIVVFANLLQEYTQKVKPHMRASPSSAQRLWAIHRVETLIRQEPSEGVVNSLSLYQALRLIKKSQDFSSQNEMMQVLDVMGHVLLNENMHAGWNAFVKDVYETNPQVLARVFRGCYALFQTDVLPYALNLMMVDYDPTKMTNESFAQIIVETMAQVQPTLEWIEKTKKEQSVWSRIDWSDADVVRAEIPKLKESYRHLFEIWKGKYEENLEGDLGPQVLLHALAQMTEQYDQIIKKVKSSENFSDDQAKLDAFMDLLDGYKEWMVGILSLLPDTAITMKNCDSVAQYQEKILTGFEYSFTLGKQHKEKCSGFLDLLQKSKDQELVPKEQMYPSLSFSSAPFTIGYEGDFSYGCEPFKTAEDFFTLFHSVMKSGIELCKKDKQKITSCLPQRVQTILPTDYSLTKMSIDSQGVVQLSYSVPFNQHAGILSYAYDPKKPESVSMCFEVYGANETGRWYTLSGYLAKCLKDNACVQMRGIPKISYGKEYGVSMEFDLHLKEQSLKEIKQNSQLVIDCFLLYANAAEHVYDKGKSLIDPPTFDCEESILYIGYLNTVFDTLYEAQDRTNIQKHILYWSNAEDIPPTVTLVTHPHAPFCPTSGSQTSLFQSCVEMDRHVRCAYRGDMAIHSPLVALLYCAADMYQEAQMSKEGLNRFLEKYSKDVTIALESSGRKNTIQAMQQDLQKLRKLLKL